MEKSRLESIIGELQEEEGKLNDRLGVLEKERSQVAREVRQIQDVLVTLGVKKAPKVKGKKRAAGKPAPNKDDVIGAVTRVLTKRGVCHEEVLREAVVADLVEQGKSRLGFQLRLKEALQDERFKEGKDGYSLVKEKV